MRLRAELATSGPHFFPAMIAPLQTHSDVQVGFAPKSCNNTEMHGFTNAKQESHPESLLGP